MVPLSQKKKKSTLISLKRDLFLFFNFLLQYLEFHMGHQCFILLGGVWYICFRLHLRARK